MTFWNTLLWVLLVLYSPIVLAWLATLFWMPRLADNDKLRLYPSAQAEPSDDCPSLMVYIPAHNEEAKIESCLNRLLAQNYPQLQITVVNDRSTDETANRVRGMMQSNSSIHLVDIKELPQGWIGKTHALAVAAAKPSTDYLLFLDSDCQLTPGSINAVMRKAIDEKLHFVSLWPWLELATRAEQLLTPPVSWLLGLWTAIDSRSAKNPSEVSLGNGQFMLFSREAYERIGGHTGVAAELAEDAIMARKVTEFGLSRWIGLGDGIYSSRRHNNFSRAADASVRVLIGTLCTPWRLFASSHLLSGGILSPFLFGLPALILSLVLQSSLSAIVGSLILAHLLVMAYIVPRLFRLFFEKPPTLIQFMTGAALCIPVVMRARRVVSGKGTVKWGSTSYRVQGSRITEAVSHN